VSCPMYRRQSYTGPFPYFFPRPAFRESVDDGVLCVYHPNSVQSYICRDEVVDHHVPCGSGSFRCWYAVEIIPHSFPIDSWLDLPYAHLPWWVRRYGHVPQRSVHPSLKGSECFSRLLWFQVRPLKGIDAKMFEFPRYPVYVWWVSLWFSQVPSLEPRCRQSSFLCSLVSHFG
jgi:hypothetical protein